MPVTLPSSPLSPSLDPASAGSGLLAGVWQVRVLGALEARNGDVVLRHFVSHAIGALLARLALLPQRTHPREELIELLWPGVELDVGRNRLRHALSSLKRLLEPPGVASGSVLVADRQGVQFAPATTRCDALEFERCVRDGRFDEAQSLYRGELLPGFYDEWVQDERARLIAVHDRIGAAAHSPAQAEPVPRVGPGQPASWPAHRPALPTYLTSYFGRESERTQLTALIGEHRLVTLNGAGGCGKTRLAVEVARAVADFDCVAFAALAECQSAGQMTAQLRVALQLPKAGGDPFDEIVGLLRDQRPLLVLDNFEQLVQSGGVPVVEALLARMPALHLLITSRRVLGLAGEHEFGLRPLPHPDPKGSVEEVARSPSVSMFVDRARSVRPDFQVTARNHEALATLCCALEGLPLAIELAASRSRAFSPDDMHAALAQRFTLLARGAARGGKTGARHDSLRGAIDWSWQLLQVPQQRLLLSLSVFRGGWSAVSAQAVSDEPQAHALLEELAADSLLRTEADASGAMRFFMLEMIREYLREHLEPAAAQRLRQRHRAHFLARALTLGQRSHAAPRDDLPNFVEAMQTAVDDAEPRLALALGVALRGEWEQHGMSTPVQGLMERALAQHAGTDKVGTEALCVQAHLVLRSALLVAGESEAAQEHVVRALALAGTQPGLRAAALLGQARQHWERSRAVAQMRPLLDEALKLARQENAVETEAGVLAALANLAFHADDRPDEAIEMFGQAQRLYEMAGIEHLANRMLFTKANCHAKKFRFGPAMSLLDECERRFLASGHVAALPELANVQGFLYAYMLRWRDAELAFARCAIGAAKQQNRYMLGFGLWNITRPLAHVRRPEAAALLMAFSARFWTTNFGALVAADLRYVEQVRRLIRVQIGGAAMERLWLRAEQLTLPAALELVAESMPVSLPASA
jgi:predicted ATPase